MSLKHRVNDNIKRRLFQKSEIKRYLYRFLIKKVLFFRFFNSFFFAKKLNNLLNRLPLKSSSVQFANRCIYSNRSRSIFCYFGLSRHSFKKLATFGLLVGVRKAVW